VFRRQRCCSLWLASSPCSTTTHHCAITLALFHHHYELAITLTLPPHTHVHRAVTCSLAACRFYPGRNEGVLLAIADSLKPESFLDEGWPAYALKGAAAAAPAAAASAAAASKGTGLRAGADAAVAAATAAAAAAVAPPPVASTADRPIITTPRAYSRAQIDSVPRPPDIDFLTTTVDFPVFQFGSFVDAFAPVGSMAQQHHIFAR